MEVIPQKLGPWLPSWGGGRLWTERVWRSFLELAVFSLNMLRFYAFVCVWVCWFLTYFLCTPNLPFCTLGMLGLPLWGSHVLLCQMAQLCIASQGLWGETGGLGDVGTWSFWCHCSDSSLPRWVQLISCSSIGFQFAAFLAPSSRPVALSLKTQLQPAWHPVPMERWPVLEGLILVL